MQDRRSILVVEDEPLILLNAATTLKDEGFEVFQAVNTAEALRLIGAHGGFDVIFTDVNLPGPLNGIELAEEVIERWPRTKLIVTSAAATLLDKDLPDHGKFFPKPYWMPDIVDAVRTMTAA